MFTAQQVELSESLLHHNMSPEIKTEEQDSIDPMPGEGRTHFPNVGKSKEEPRHNVKEEPEENPSKNWDAQLQEFLKTLQDPQERREDPQCLESKLWSGPKLTWRSSQGGMDTSNYQPLDIQNWLRRNGPDTCLHAVSLAEEFFLMREEIQTWEQQVTEISEEDIGEAPKSNQLPSEPTKDEDFGMIKEGGDGSKNLRCYGDASKISQLETGAGWLNEGGAPKLKNSESREPLRMSSKAAIKTDSLAFKENDGNRDMAPKQNGREVGKGVGQLVNPQSVFPELSDPAVQEEEINNNGSGERMNHHLKIMTAEIPSAEEKLFRCWHCGQSFRNSSHLVAHERTHIGEKLYKCSQCGESERTHTGQMPHQCSHCGCTLGCHAHEKISMGEKPYVCSECGKSCSQESDLLKHQRTHAGENPYECSACGNNFRKESSIKVHQRIHTGEKPCKCLSSGECFIWSSQFQLHERTHTSVCSHCGKSFDQKSELLEHKKTHLVEDLLACFACGKIFELGSELMVHVRTHKEKPFECSACGKTFTNSLQLIAHQKVHTGEKPHKCSHCGKSFSHRQSLIAHKRIYTGEKPHKCLICGKNFQNAQNLKFHEKTHMGEKSYRCSHCDKSFRWNSQLLLHNRIHTGEKPYPCSDCGRTFDRKGNLLRHVRIHIGQRPYVCSDCGESFTTNSVLLRHQKVHMGEDVAKCLECGKDFRQRKDQAEKMSKCPECIQGPSLCLEGAQMQLKEETFECSLCRKTFKNSSQLMFHQSVHTEVRPRQCLECGRNIIRRPNLIAPLKNTSGQTPHKCSECEKRLN